MGNGRDGEPPQSIAVGTSAQGRIRTWTGREPAGYQVGSAGTWAGRRLAGRRPGSVDQRHRAQRRASKLPRCQRLVAIIVDSAPDTTALPGRLPAASTGPPGCCPISGAGDGSGPGQGAPSGPSTAHLRVGLRGGFHDSGATGPLLVVCPQATLNNKGHARPNSGCLGARLACIDAFRSSAWSVMGHVTDLVHTLPHGACSVGRSFVGP